jgi:hypothetical protein
MSATTNHNGRRPGEGGVGAIDVHNGRWISGRWTGGRWTGGRWIVVRVTGRAAPSVVSVRIAMGALFALGLLQWWIALAQALRLSIVGGVLDAHPDLSATIANAILRPYWVSALGGAGAIVLGVALVVAAGFVRHTGFRARWPALGLVAVAVAGQVMAVLIGLSSARNRPVIGGGGSDPFGGAVLMPRGDPLGGLTAWAGAVQGVPSSLYGEVTASVDQFSRADTAVSIVTFILGAVALLALRPADRRRGAAPPGPTGGDRPAEPDGRGWGAAPLPVLLAGGLLALAGVFALIAFGTVRRLSTAYDVAGSWELSAFAADQLSRPFVRAAFLTGTTSLLLAAAAMTVAVAVYRGRPRAGLAAAALSGLAAVPLLVGLLLGFASDRAPGRLAAQPADDDFLSLGYANIRLPGQAGSGWATADDELTSRLLGLSTADTAGQVIGLLVAAFVLLAIRLGGRPWPSWPRASGTLTRRRGR